MARYKYVDTSPWFLPVSLTGQLRTGTFEYVLNHLLDSETDLSVFDRPFKNEPTAAELAAKAATMKGRCFIFIGSPRARESASRTSFRERPLATRRGLLEAVNHDNAGRYKHV